MADPNDPFEITPDIQDLLDDYGIGEPAELGYFGDFDPDVRRGQSFSTFEEAIVYLTDEVALLHFSRIYYDEVSDSFYVAIPDDTQ